MIVSIIIRTLNEAKHLGDLLATIELQITKALEIEVVVVDSGSTDGTIEIAKSHGVRLTSIEKSEFSFGRALNIGCDYASGDLLVFISGHCIPVDEFWLQNLCQPLIDRSVVYAYGLQVGDDTNNFSERRIFAKYFPAVSQVPQAGYFCNNANAAIIREVWEQYKFDEEITGLEDMAMGKTITEDSMKIGYVAEAAVFHHHEESWAQISRRFEREALALQKIMPEIQISLMDVFRFILASTVSDWFHAWRNGSTSTSFLEMFRYRISQYIGSYKGNKMPRRLAALAKERFFYPNAKKETQNDQWLKSMRRPTPNEGKQPTRQRQEL
ncbi:glycosyltransferase family 2 protein [Planktomarina temperata]|nr:glycosyltransferase family 2 protein [Planktomarina temperata]